MLAAMMVAMMGNRSEFEVAETLDSEQVDRLDIAMVADPVVYLVVEKAA